MKKIKVTIDGKEQEITLPDGFVSKTELLSDDSAFKEAAQMRGFKFDDNLDTKKPIDIDLSNNPAIKALTDQVSALTQALTDEKAARKEAAERLQQQAAEAKTKKISESIEKAISEGRITPEDKEKWTKRLESDFENGSEILLELPKNPSVDGSGSDNKDGDGKNIGGTPKTTGNPILDAVARDNQTAILEN